MRKIMSFLMILVVVLLGGCSTQKIPKVIEKKVENVITFKNKIYRAAMYMSGINTMGVYNLESKDNKYSLCTYDDQGNLLEEISFDSGKGPGELFYPSHMFMTGGYYWFHSTFSQTLSKFDISGKFIDSYLLEGTNDYGALGMIDGDLVYHGLGLTLLKKIDLKTNKVIESLEYNSKIKNDWIDPKKWDNMAIAGGCLLVDDDRNKIYIGYYNKPYRIEEYDSTFKLVRTFRFDLGGDYVIYRRGRGGFSGDCLISSMRIHDNRLYACYGHTWWASKKGSARITKNPFFILVYDLETGKLAEKITCPHIDDQAVGVFIIGVKNDKIYLYVIGNPESMQSFGDSIGYNLGNQYGAIIVVK